MNPFSKIQLAAAKRAEAGKGKKAKGTKSKEETSPCLFTKGFLIL